MTKSTRAISSPPVAKRIEHTHEAHGDKRSDPYCWLNDRKDPDVIDYIEAENRYLEDALAHLQPLQDKIYEEMVERIPQSDISAPNRDGNWEYFHTREAGKNYRTHYRRKAGSNQAAQLLVDENAIAAGHRFFRAASVQHSPCHRFVGYAVDTAGHERCDIFFLDLETGRLLGNVLSDVSGDFEWSGDSSYVLYTRVNAAQRPYQVWLHRFDTMQTRSDELLFEERDAAFYLQLSQTACRQVLLINASSNNTSEVHLLASDAAKQRPRMVFERKYGIEYSVEIRDDEMYVLTNEDAQNFKLMQTSAMMPDKSSWKTVIAHRNDTALVNFIVFESHIVVCERRNGAPGIAIVDPATFETTVVERPDNVQELQIGTNLQYRSSICRLVGNALNLPVSHYDFDMKTGECSLIKTAPVGGDFDPQRYVAERYFATSADGAQVPLYLIYARSADRTRPMPVVLNGYGSYGISYSLYFSSSRLSLLDRGIGFAIAHLRGGGELGEGWYHDGKLLNKKNTFEDFDACAKHLFESGICEPSKLAVCGGSAGGLVVGNYINAHPDRCKAAVAHVPFVDILTTILDDALPLSVTERDEWGDPNDEQTYHYMKSYSPYDNTRPMHYPAMLVTAGLNDVRVGYWEPAKWVAKIRHMKQDGNPLLLKTEMHAGHGGKSRRYDALEDKAQEYAFILSQLKQEALGEQCV